MPRYPFNVSVSVHNFRGMHCLYHTLTICPGCFNENLDFVIFFLIRTTIKKNLLRSQSLVCLCYPYLYDQATYGINHTELCCVCRYLWSRGFSKIPHSLCSCGIFQKPLDHKYLHTSIVQYCLYLHYYLCNIFSIIFGGRVNGWTLDRAEIWATNFQMQYLLKFYP